MDELVNNVLKMKKKGDTVFEYFEDNEYNRERDIVGYSVVQVISLSSIVLHLDDISRTCYIDIFTCGDLKLDDIKRW
jgi:S-adenosylmethionine/arginine decarboxylase-like enzyme